MVTALALAALIAVPPPLPSPPAPEAGPQLVLVRGGAWYGSGVVWDAGARRVLTALHVVEEMPADGIEVVLAAASPSPVALRARVIDRDPTLDLALLELEVGAGDGPPLGAAPPLGHAARLRSGEAVTLAACADGRCAPAAGTVLAATRRYGGARYLALAAPASPGSSGGAVLDARGALVGIVDLTLAREPGVALAVPVEGAAARFPRS